MLSGPQILSGLSEGGNRLSVKGLEPCFIDRPALNLVAMPTDLATQAIYSVILNETRMRRTRVTPLCYLAATDASGGVERQQKITHAHESPFDNYAKFPHPFAITYRGKKYSRILFGQTSYVIARLDDTEQWIDRNGEGSDHCLTYGTVSAFTERGWDKLEKNVALLDVPTTGRIANFQSANQMRLISRFSYITCHISNMDVAGSSETSVVSRLQGVQLEDTRYERW
jgi:hypothetical protein